MCDAGQKSLGTQINNSFLCFQIWPFYSSKLHSELTESGSGKFLRQKLHCVVSSCLHLRIRWALWGVICITLTNIQYRLFSIVLLSNNSSLILRCQFWFQVSSGDNALSRRDFIKTMLLANWQNTYNYLWKPATQLAPTPLTEYFSVAEKRQGDIYTCYSSLRQTLNSNFAAFMTVIYSWARVNPEWILSISKY